MTVSLRRGAANRLALLGMLALAGCNALPASGPEERDILRSERSQANQLGFRIITVDARTTAVLARERGNAFAALTAMNTNSPVDTIGPGDVLAISVFEIGSGLFAGSGGNASEQAGLAGVSTAATQENLPPIEVDRSGFISVPYVGRIRAAGRTPDQLQDAITAGLRSHSQNPQVLVEVKRDINNAVIISGDVHKPGRVPLTLAHERLLDVIALAEGPTHPAQDTMVELIRNGRSGEVALTQVQGDMRLNVPMQPLDRVQLTFRPRTYTVFGATRVAEVPFTATRLSLAESIARVGGPLDERADPNAVFLFRFEPPAVARGIGLPAGTAPVPVIYHLDMMNTNSYFLAQQFPMRDKDLIYIANARTDQLGKFLGLIGQLFGPAVLTHSLSTGNSF